jgi:hypothetical protein
VPFLAEEEEAVHPDRWVLLPEGERREKSTGSGKAGMGRGLILSVGPKGSLVHFYIIFLF